ncbi:MAG: HAD hydrolase-like protein, partial [Gammaproteobacteria bacterium]|nr:HAD hydrolase-like protein [Gammaproteobacteria bacterium]
MSSFQGGVLFDLDGTLVDTAPDFIRAANELRNQHGFVTLAPETIAEQVSNGAIAVTRVTFGIDEQHAQFDARRQELLDSYEKHLGAAAVLYPGLDELLAQFEQQAIPWGVVTNKPERYAQPLLERLALDQRCSVLVCPDHLVDRKPHPEG